MSYLLDGITFANAPAMPDSGKVWSQMRPGPVTLRPNFNCKKGSVTAAAAACMPRRGSFVGV